jgi:hypothetical protein
VRRWFADLSVSKKLYGLAGGLIVLLVVTGLFSIANLSSASTQGRDMYQNATVPIERLATVRAELGAVDPDLARVSLSTGNVSQLVATYQADRLLLAKAVSGYTELGLSPAEQQIYAKFRALDPQYASVGAPMTAFTT